MANRPNWHYDHPPACTCARCAGGSRPTQVGPKESDSDRRPPASDPTANQDDSKGGMGCLAWIALVIAILLIVSFIISAVGSFNFGAESPTPRPSVVQMAPAPTVTPNPIFRNGGKE